MFTKSLILVLLGSTLILASPSEGEQAPATEATPISQQIWGFFKKVGQGIANAWSSGKEKVSAALQEIKGSVKNATEIAKDGYDYLYEKGVEALKKAADSIKAEKELWDKKIAEIKNSGKESAQTIVYKIKNLEKQAEEAIGKKIKEAKETWQHWKEQARREYEKGSQEEKH